MSATITYAVEFFLGTYLIILLVDVVLSRAVWRFFIQLVLAVIVVLVLRATTGFPSYRQSFGGLSPAITIVVMLVSTVVGIVAQYFFSLKGRFSWRTFLKPICITPIVLLPLLGTMQTSTNLQTLQVISLAFISFQNGFFWEVVIQHAESKI
jgi:hypothetical protein